MTMPPTLDTIIAKQMCTGCGACAALSNGRIRMQETETSNRRPNLARSPSAANDALLTHACPALDTRADSGPKSDLEAAFGEIVAVYEAYAADPDIRFQGSSGGAVTALALASLGMPGTSGVLHVKASKTDPLRNEAAISRTRSELMEGAGSRYAPASVADHVPAIIDEPGATTVIGKPCDISGVRAVADRDARIAASVGTTISIFCAGTPSHQGTLDLLDALGAPRDVQSVRYRGQGWPGEMTATWQTPDGVEKSASMSYEKGWGDILQARRQWRCYLCTDHTGEEADLAVGDPWQRPSGEDGAGRSLVIVRTARGQKLLDAAIKAGHLIAQRVPDTIVAQAQPNLIAAKGHAFGRSLALKLAGIKAPTLRRDSFHCWWHLGMRAKVQSVVGTWKRIRRKGLDRDHSPAWQNAAESQTPVHSLGQGQG